ncbi:hypothetical protein ACULMD_01360, partial [Xanthomonas arboricola pv. corylina]
TCSSVKRFFTSNLLGGRELDSKLGCYSKSGGRRPEQRCLLVTQTGTRLARSTLKTAWQRLITAAIEAGVIAEESRFTLHGLKHRGITDTRGTRAHKQDAAGHVTPQMTHRYDHELQVIPPPALPTEQVVAEALAFADLAKPSEP